MPAPTSTAELIDLVRKSGLYEGDTFDNRLGGLPRLPEQPVSTATMLVKHGLITKFQAKLLLLGKYRGFRIGPYTIKEQIGQGGMGAVYLAEHNTLLRKVALKVLTPGADADQKITVERFLREARSAAALDHPNIVRLHDVGQFGTSHYLVMEYVEGETLDRIVQRGNSIPCGRAVEYIAQAASGLQHAYEKGFVHRDIKPANLILAKDGTIKILDMGLARSSEERDKLTQNIDVGAIVGTADYISPEQAVNDPGIDIRADIYSLGATFYSLVTGRPPFSGNTTQKLVQHQMKDAPSLTRMDKTLPKDLAEVVAKMMAKKKEQRFRTPADVIAALTPWLPNSGRVVAGLTHTEAGSNGGSGQETLDHIVASSTKSLTKSLKRAIAGDRKKYWLVGAGAIGVLLLGALIGSFLFGGSKPDVAKNSPVTPPQGTGSPVVSPKGQTNSGGTTAKRKPNATGKSPGTVYTFVPKDLNGMNFAVDGHDVSSGAKPNLPATISLHCWKPGSKGEFRGETVDDRPAIRFASRNEPCSAQVRFDVENEGGVALLEGREYEFRVTYRTQGHHNAKLSLMTSKFDYLGGVDMAPAEGEWKTASIVGRRQQLPLCCSVNAEAVNEDGFVTVASVEVIDLDAAKSTPPVYVAKFAGLSPGVKAIQATDTMRQGYEISGQPLPKGIMLNQYDKESAGEYSLASVDGTIAFGIRHLDGNGGTQVNIAVEEEDKLPTGEVATIRVVYQYRGTGIPFVAMEEGNPTYKKYNQTTLVPTGAQWKTLEIPFERPSYPQKMMLVLNAGKATHADRNQATVWFQSIEIIGPGSATAQSPSKPAPPRDPVAPIDPAMLTFETKLNEWKPFRFSAEGTVVSSGTRPAFPKGFLVHCWDAKSVAQFVGADAGDGYAIGMTNLNETASAQFLTELEFAKTVFLVPGKRYAVRVEYKTANEGAGTVDFQTDEYATLTTAPLESTGGQWATKDVPLTRQDGKPVRIAVNGTGVGEGNSLHVRRVAVYEVK